MPIVKYRVVAPHLPPRRTKLDVPGWAGEPQPRADGSHEYPWHCIPFSEAARAGMELCFPYKQEIHVSTRGGQLWFEDDQVAGTGSTTPKTPFRSFGKAYYTYQSLLDLKVEDPCAIKTETHPRFYTDTTGTVPIAVPALIRPWWPMIYFMVFKSPAEGQTHIFRPGEPFMQISIAEADAKFDLAEMPEEEAAERELQSQTTYSCRKLTKKSKKIDDCWFC